MLREVQVMKKIYWWWRLHSPDGSHHLFGLQHLSFVTIFTCNHFIQVEGRLMFTFQRNPGSLSSQAAWVLTSKEGKGAADMIRKNVEEMIPEHQVRQVIPENIKIGVWIPSPQFRILLENTCSTHLPRHFSKFSIHQSRNRAWNCKFILSLMTYSCMA